MRKSDLAGSAVIAVAVALAFTSSCTKSAEQRFCYNAAAIDGDTIKCDDGTRLRLNGIDAPETSTHGEPPNPIHNYDFAAGQRSWAYLAYVVDSNTLRYVPLKEDKYGRTVAQVFIKDSGGRQGEDLSCYMLENKQAVYVSKWDEYSVEERTCEHVG